MMAEYGLVDPDLDKIDELFLLGAYVRRQKALSRLTAAEIGRLFLSGSDTSGNTKQVTEISTAEMFERIK